ncbi:phospholipase D-like protein [Desulfitobacterium sp. LBE]|uniref:phospholipase D-like domain-containing protein n=1 Tax=Desulfitobacterium sp. LBE TaxID=884086 RepID=UPI00119C413D|nr:phospholipase D-like domain-containing protein [Desulfitobacterium sp. LBE]TWH59344.1 phospholipase D-like protein [Desulfitobacterium sp. LBE]
MRDRSIGIAIIVETLVSEVERFGGELFDLQVFKQSFRSIKEKFPVLTDEETFDLIQMAISLYNYRVTEKVELVITAPNSFKLKALKTSVVIKELINGAQKSITLTGYSISDYFCDLLDVLVEKSRKGIYINLYVNDFNSKKEQLDKLEMYKGRYMSIYDYNKGDDKMAALHAKIVVVDGCKTFISSSNLSYHGLEGNVEMGVVIDSVRKASNVEELFKQLRTQKVFKKL